MNPTVSKIETVELKPCPFCGHKISAPYWEDFGTDDSYYVIECGYCGAMMYDNDEDEVVDLWNSRVRRCAALNTGLKRSARSTGTR